MLPIASCSSVRLSGSHQSSRSARAAASSAASASRRTLNYFPYSPYVGSADYHSQKSHAARGLDARCFRARTGKALREALSSSKNLVVFSRMGGDGGVAAERAQPIAGECEATRQARHVARVARQLRSWWPARAFSDRLDIASKLAAAIGWRCYSARACHTNSVRTAVASAAAYSKQLEGRTVSPS